MNTTTAILALLLTAQTALAATATLNFKEGPATTPPTITSGSPLGKLFAPYGYSAGANQTVSCGPIVYIQADNAFIGTVLTPPLDPHTSTGNPNGGQQITIKITLQSDGNMQCTLTGAASAVLYPDTFNVADNTYGTLVPFRWQEELPNPTGTVGTAYNQIAAQAPNGCSDAQIFYQYQTSTSQQVADWSTQTESCGVYITFSPGEMALMTASPQASTEPTSAPSTSPSDLSGPIGYLGDAALTTTLTTADQSTIESIATGTTGFPNSAPSYTDAQDALGDLFYSGPLGTEIDTGAGPPFPGNVVQLNSQYNQAGGLWNLMTGGSDSTSNTYITQAFTALNSFSTEFPQIYIGFHLLCTILYSWACLKLAYRGMLWALGARQDPIMEDVTS